MTTRFDDMQLSAPLLAAVSREGYDTPTPVQERAIPAALEGRDVLACAQTGTGKTAAFTLPMIDRLMRDEPDKTRRGPATPRALVLTPTRELAQQVDESLRTYGRGSGLYGAVVVGGVSQHRQTKQIRAGIDALVATPGRLIDLMQQGIVDLSDVGIFVLDEADRMLDMGFIQPIRDIAKALREDRQTLLFSATMPKSIEKLANSLLRDPVRIEIAPVAQTTALIEQSVYMVRKTQKTDLMHHLLGDPTVERAVIFTRTKHGADKLSKKLAQQGTTASAIHGDKPQRQRERALEAFRDGRSRVLVATDVAARGLDVDGITHVFNFDIPNEPETYVHRIGRTGRAGATGNAVSLCDNEERGYLKAIERLTKARVPRADCPQAEGVEIQTESAPSKHERSESRPHAKKHGSKHAGSKPGGFKKSGTKHGGAKRKNTRRDDDRRPGAQREESAESSASPKRKPRRSGGPGWGVEGSSTKKKRPAHKKKANSAGRRHSKQGDAGPPGTGVKRVRRSDVS